MPKFIVNRSTGFPVCDNPSHPFGAEIELEDGSEEVAAGYLVPIAPEVKAPVEASPSSVEPAED